MTTTIRQLLGVRIGDMTAGERDNICDVPGVTVGHCTIDTPEHQTGVTVVMPCEDNPFLHKLPAACFVLNGFGKTQGLVQVEELGQLETPIALTNTLNVGLVHDAIVDYMVERCAREGVEVKSINPVVGECNDASLNRISERAVTKEHVLAAISSASADFAQGAVGAGRGTVCYGFKGGIGSASRKIRLDGKVFHIGALVQSNMGSTEDFMVNGRFLGREILRTRKGRLEPAEVDKGSIIMLLATDIPLSDRQLKRVIKRAAVGLTRTGSHLGHGSGDIMVGFTTAYRLAGEGDGDIVTTPSLNENCIEKVFRGAAEAVEEAILNSLASAETVTGYQGCTKYALSEFLPMEDKA